MNPTERYQRNRARYHALVRRHDLSGPNVGLFLNDLQQLVDELHTAEMADAESTVPPSIAALKRAGWYIDRSVWAAVERGVAANKIAPKELERAAREWVLKGWRKNNVDGLIDWIVNGGAEQARPGTPKPNAPRELPDDPAKW